MSTRHRKYILLLCTVLFSTVLSADDTTGATHNIGEFLLTYENDSIYQTQKKKTEFLHNSRKDVPFIDDIELRIRNQGFAFDRQRYTLRVEPNGFGVTKAERNLLRKRKAYHECREELLMNEMLRERYMLVLELNYRKKMLELQEDLRLLYKDRINVLDKMTGSRDFELDDLIKAENDFGEISSEIFDAKYDLRRHREEIEEMLSDRSFNDFDTTGFITISFISDYLREEEIDCDTNNVYLRENRLAFQVSEGRYELENAEGREYISFLEFAYDQDDMLDEIEDRNEGDEYNLNNAFIMEVGLRLPFINEDRDDVNRRKVDYLSEKENYEELKKDLMNKAKKDSADIRVRTSTYRYLEKRRDSVNVESSLKKYMQMEGVDPRVLLSIKEKIIKNDMRMEELRYDIMQDYIRVLDITGILSRQPLRNYLYQDWRVINNGR